MSIKLSFENTINNKNNNINSIDDILLSKNNPRFTVITNLNINLADFIIQNLSDSKESQENVYYELLENEGDLSDLIRLSKNVLEFGFINKNEEILLVFDPKLKKYVVAEGNRRIMLLKIITNCFNFPKEEFFLLSFLIIIIQNILMMKITIIMMVIKNKTLNNLLQSNWWKE